MTSQLNFYHLMNVVMMIPTISTIPLLQLASGDRLFLQVYKFIGANPGKKVYIQANLHGAEIAGNAVIHQLIEFLLTLDETALTGEIWLVPVCNPLGTNQRSHHFSPGRFNAYDGQNWNRIFWDYEKEGEDIEAFARDRLHLDPAVIQSNYRQQINHRFQKLLAKIQAPRGVQFSESFRYKLQSLCLDADYVIDLHTSTNQGIDYLFYFRDRHPSAKLFLFDYGLLLDKYDGDAFDEAFIKPWLALEAAFLKLGRTIIFDVEAWTLELGSGMQLNPDSVTKGLRGIKNYLVQKQVLAISDRSLRNTSNKMILATASQVKKYYATTGGMIQSRINLGTSIKAGERLYQILSFNKQENLPILIDIPAEDSGIVYEVSTNYSVNEGEYVLGIISLGDRRAEN